MSGVWCLILLSACVCLTQSRSQPESESRNVIQVPPNCPPGQMHDGTSCREVWRNGRTEMEIQSLGRGECGPGDPVSGPCDGRRGLHIKCTFGFEYYQGKCSPKKNETPTAETEN